MPLLCRNFCGKDVKVLLSFPGGGIGIGGKLVTSTNEPKELLKIIDGLISFDSKFRHLYLVTLFLLLSNLHCLWHQIDYVNILLGKTWKMEIHIAYSNLFGTDIVVISM